MIRSIAVGALALLALPVLADDDVRHRLRASIPASAVRRVVIDIPAGDVTLRNVNNGTINVTGEVRRSYDGYRQREKQQAMVDDINVAVKVRGDEAVVERTFGPGAGSWTARSFHTDFRITVEVPRGLDVQIGTRYGDVSLDGDFGDIYVDLHAGEINLRTPRSAVRDIDASVRVGEVQADLGDQRVSNEGFFPRAVSYHNASGRSRVSLHTTAGEVHVTSLR